MYLGPDGPKEMKTSHKYYYGRSHFNDFNRRKKVGRKIIAWEKQVAGLAALDKCFVKAGNEKTVSELKINRNQTEQYKTARRANGGQQRPIESGHFETAAL
ncbi:unnamed protein product [Calicophoron daubneyi]|uniref:Uncharacterized protein n=1 Tax=Calicophoron daubneyi TaxID=300641 RepID=A0AAV2TIK6_CALDB